ncbi:MAG: dienelactone hydrolase family protein [Pseudomonadota bacterium]
MRFMTIALAMTLMSMLAIGTAPTAEAAGETVTYEIAGGPYEGYQVKAVGPSKGLVLVIHDWDGLTDYEIKRADMLAELGYDAFAVDLYGKGNRPVETGAKKAEIGKLYSDRETFRKRIIAGLAEARKTFSGSTVVMGYCFGGAAVLELARSGKAPDVKGYVSFHGGLDTPDGQNYSQANAPLLIAHGAADKGIPMQAVATLTEELESAGATYTIEVYSGAPHAFTVFGSNRYQERADTLSWASFQNFLGETLTN